jgi:hypothetical protein
LNLTPARLHPKLHRIAEHTSRDGGLGDFNPIESTQYTPLQRMSNFSIFLMKLQQLPPHMLKTSLSRPSQDGARSPRAPG